MTEPKRHDFAALCRELITLYAREHHVTLTPYKLGLMINKTDKNVVRGWLRGVQPRHYEGELILAYLEDYRAMFPVERQENFPTSHSKTVSGSA